MLLIATGKKAGGQIMNTISSGSSAYQALAQAQAKLAADQAAKAAAAVIKADQDEVAAAQAAAATQSTSSSQSTHLVDILA
jgi:hypothetical protein